MSQIIFITGPSGSGKTTTATKVAEMWPEQCVVLDLDKIRTFIRSGYAEPSDGWNDETQRQWGLAREVVGAMAQLYMKRGVSVVAEAFATPQDYSVWKKELGSSDLATFVLLPPLEVAIKRNNERTGAAHLGEAEVRQNHEWSESWGNVEGVVVIDNSVKAVDEVVRQIIEAVYLHDG